MQDFVTPNKQEPSLELSLSRDVSLATGLVEIFPFGSTTEGASGATCAISITDQQLFIPHDRGIFLAPTQVFVHLGAS
jgi:hypothetical protein